MSKVNVEHTQVKDSFFVSAATIATGWKPGMIMTLDTTGKLGQLSANNDSAMFVAIDDPTALSAPPTGSLVTGIYGSGTRFIIDHTAEVAAGSAVYAFEADVLMASTNTALYCSSNGKWTTSQASGSVAASGSVLGRVMQVPAASNSYSLEIKLTGM